MRPIKYCHEEIPNRYLVRLFGHWIGIPTFFFTITRNIPVSWCTAQRRRKYLVCEFFTPSVLFFVNAFIGEFTSTRGCVLTLLCIHIIFMRIIYIFRKIFRQKPWAIIFMQWFFEQQTLIRGMSRYTYIVSTICMHRIIIYYFLWRITGENWDETARCRSRPRQK